MNSQEQQLICPSQSTFHLQRFKQSQPILFSLPVKNSPITSTDTEVILTSWKEFANDPLLIGWKEMIWILCFGVFNCSAGSSAWLLYTDGLSTVYCSLIIRNQTNEKCSICYLFDAQWCETVIMFRHSDQRQNLRPNEKNTNHKVTRLCPKQRELICTSSRTSFCCDLVSLPGKTRRRLILRNIIIFNVDIFPRFKSCRLKIVAFVKSVSGKLLIVNFGDSHRSPWSGTSTKPRLVANCLISYIIAVLFSKQIITPFNEVRGR